MPSAFTGALDYVVYVLICIQLQAEKDARHSSEDDVDSARSYVLEFCK